jgi:hypothetical protein
LRLHYAPRLTETRRPRRRTLSLAITVLSRRHPGQGPFAGLDPKESAGDVLPIHDPGHFAIGSGPSYSASIC